MKLDTYLFGDGARSAVLPVPFCFTRPPLEGVFLLLVAHPWVRFAEHRSCEVLFSAESKFCAEMSLLF